MALRDHLAVPAIMETVATDSGNPALSADERQRLAQLCLGIPNSGAADLALDYLKQNPPAVVQMGDSAYQLLRYVSQDRLDDVYELMLTRRKKDAAQETVILMGLQRAARDRGAKLPDPIMQWGLALANQLLANKRGSTREQGIDLAAELRLVETLPRLAKIAVKDAGSDLRVGALLASVTIDGPGSIGLLKSILGNTSEELPLRQRAARALGNVNNEQARQELIDYLPKAPERLAVEIANSLAASKPGAEALLSAISTGKASAALLQEPAVVDRLKQQKLDNLDEQVTQLTANLPTRDQRVRVLIEDRLVGLNNGKLDLAKGKQVFVKNCAACHKIGGEGVKIGPELDGIGIRGPERIMEDVLDPSRNVDQLFRTTMFSANGKPYSGLLKSENDQVIVIIDSLGKDVTVNVADVDEGSRRISPLSPMPANVQDLVPEEDFYHLMAFLLSHQPKQADAGQQKGGEAGQ